MTWRHRLAHWSLRRRALWLLCQGHRSPLTVLLARGKYRELDRLVEELEW